MGRPGYLQRWGYDAAPGACVQPPDGMAGDGFPTGYRPPAQWFNWCFGNWSDWINYLRGANHEAWTRTAWGTSPSTFDAGSALFLAVDTETVDAVGAAYRYVIAGQETASPNTAALRVSKRGNEWLQRTNVTATTTALPTALAYVANPVSSGRWLLGCNDGSINYCTCDAGGGTGPVGSGSGNWSVASTPGGMTNVVAFAAKDSTAIFALTNDGGAVSTNHGLVWSDYAGTSGTGRSGNGSDAVWTGTAFVFITTDGQIYKSAVVGGTFAYQTDLGGTATWKLATDGDSGVLAYRVGSGSLLDIFWSSDDGGTWETITPTSGFNRIQRIRHHEGTWLACSTVAPFLWASNDHENWRKLRMPVGSDAALYDLAWDGGAWVVAGNGFVLQCPRGHDPGDADGSWSPAAGAAPLVDAGYLRGIEVSATAPTNGQVLVYNSTSGYWEPGAAGSSSPTTTRGDLIRRGASADERFAAKAADTFVGGDGTDVAVRTVAQVRTSLGLVYREDATTPLLWWKCDSTNVAATTLANSGSAGTANLTLTSAKAGALGPWGEPALQIGTSGYALAPVNVAQPTGALTLALWFRQSALGAARLIVRPYGGAWLSPYTAADLYIDGSGVLGGGIAGGGAERRAASAGPVARAGEWHHAALTYDGSTIRIYQDGVEMATASYSGTVDYGADPTTTAWCVGGNSLVTSEQVAGEICDVRVYDSALSAGVIARMHRRGRGTYDGT